MKLHFHLVFLGIAVVLQSQLLAGGTKASFVRTESLCTGRLASGEQYEMQRRIFHWVGKNGDVYTDAVAYYAPSSGAFLWWGQGYTEAGYLKYVEKSGKVSCTLNAKQTTLVRDSEWVDF